MMPQENPLKMTHAEKGRVLAKAGKFAEAIVELKTAVTLNPWNTEAQRHLGLALRENGDLPQALAVFQRLVVLDAGDADIHNKLGNIWRSMGNSGEAMKSYQKAVRLNPSDWAPHLNIANMLLEKRRIEPAILHIQKALFIQPDLPEAERLLAHVYALRRRSRLSQRFKWALRKLRRRETDPDWNPSDMLRSASPNHFDGRLECVYNKSGLRAALSVVEQEYTEEWLSLHKPQQKIQKVWKSARRFVNDDAPEGEALSDLDLLDLVKFISDLSVAQSLTGFDADVRPRLKGPDQDLEKVKYEVFVGSILAQGEHEAEFIPPSRGTNVKTADLKIMHPSKPIFVECKRKDSYLLLPDGPAPKWQSTLDKTMKFLQGAGADLDITYITPSGTELSDPNTLFDAVEAQVTGGHRGLTIFTQTGVGFIIRDMVAPQASENVVAAMHARRINLAQVSVEFTGGDDGLMHPSHPRRVSVLFLDSHKLRTIVESFNTARRQIPEDGPGVIYIDVDISLLDPRDITLYLDSMLLCIRGLFTPNSNTRVGAVVLTTQPIYFQEMTPNGLQTSSEIVSGVIHNMHSEKLVDIPAIPQSRKIQTNYIGQTTIDYGMNLTETTEQVLPPN